MVSAKMVRGLEKEKARIIKERLEFIKLYIEWIKKVPNKEWSAQQAILINALLENAVNMPLTKEKYLALVDGNGKTD